MSSRPISTRMDRKIHMRSPSIGFIHRRRHIDVKSGSDRRSLCVESGEKRRDMAAQQGEQTRSHGDIPHRVALSGVKGMFEIADFQK